MPKLCTSYGSRYTDDSPQVIHKSYTLGRYKIEYDILEFKFLGNGSYKGLFSYNKDYNSEVKIYEDGELINYSHENSFTHDPCHDVIIGGDGLTRETTYILQTPICRDTVGNICNLNSEVVQTIHEAGDTWYITHRVNDNYYISMGYDMCTHHIYIGVCDIKLLFKIDDTDLTRPYNNARVGIPTDNYNTTSYFPAEATADGLIVHRLIPNPTETMIIKGNWKDFDEFLRKQDYEQDSFYTVKNYLNDDNKKEYGCAKITSCELQKVYKGIKLVNYEEVDNFDFECNENNLEEMLKILGISLPADIIKGLNQIVDANLISPSGTVSIPLHTRVLRM